MTQQDESIFDTTQLGVLGDIFLGPSTSKVLDFLLMFREFDYSESDIARSSGVSVRNIYRITPKLEYFGLIEKTRTSGRAKMYKINSNSEAIQHLEKFTYLIAKQKIQKENSKIPIQSILDKEPEISEQVLGSTPKLIS